MEVISWILVVSGLIVGLIGGIWFLVVAFQESVLWGLGCLFVPLVCLVFLIMHCDKAGKPFVIHLAGVFPMIAGAIVRQLI